MRLRNSILFHFSFIFIIIFLLFFFVSDEFRLEIFQGRDLLRAFRLTEGSPIFWGPEISGGGNSPGSFFYMILGLPIALTGNILAGSFSLVVMVSFIVCTLAGFQFNNKKFLYSGAIVFLIYTPLFNLILQNFNPSYSVLFFLLSLLSYAFFIEKKNHNFVYLAFFLIALGIQVHMSLLLILLAMITHYFFIAESSGKKINFLWGGLAFILPLTPYLFFSSFFHLISDYLFIQDKEALLAAGSRSGSIDWFAMVPIRWKQWYEGPGFLIEALKGLISFIKNTYFINTQVSILSIVTMLFLVKSFLSQKKYELLRFLKVVMIFQLPVIIWQITLPEIDIRYLIGVFSVFLITASFSLRYFSYHHPYLFLGICGSFLLTSPYWNFSPSYIWPFFCFFVFCALYLFRRNIKVIELFTFFFLTMFISFYFSERRNQIQQSVVIHEDGISVNCFDINPYGFDVTHDYPPFAMTRTLKNLEKTFLKEGVGLSNLLVQGFAVETEINLFLPELDKLESSDQFFLINLQIFCTEGKLLELKNEDIVKALPFIPNGLMTKDSEFKVVDQSDHAILAKVSPVNNTFQNFGEPYKGIPKEIIEYEKLQESVWTLTAPSKGAVLFKNCSLKSCWNLIQLNYFDKERALELAVIGTPLSQVGELLNPVWSEYWKSVKVTYSCEDKSIRTLLLASDIGVTSEFEGKTILTPLKVKVILPCELKDIHELIIEGRRKIVRIHHSSLEDIRLEISIR